MTIREHAALFGANRGLVAVVTDGQRSAEPGTTPLGAIWLNAGVIHRVGPSRLHVRVARELASGGWIATRFDHSGVGDSPGRRDGLSFSESAIAEVREVMDSLQHTHGIDRFVLLGLCSGAVTAFDTAAADARVVGAVMINPQGFDDNSEWNQYVLNRSRARRYWTESLLSPASWRNVLTGRTNYRQLIDVLWTRASTSRSSEGVVGRVRSAMAARLQALLERRTRLLFLCSEGDDGIEYLNVILGQDIRTVGAGPCLDVRILPSVDHSLTLLEGQRRVVDEIRGWAAALAAECREARELVGARGGSIRPTSVSSPGAVQ